MAAAIAAAAAAKDKRDPQSTINHGGPGTTLIYTREFNDCRKRIPMGAESGVDDTSNAKSNQGNKDPKKFYGIISFSDFHNGPQWKCLLFKCVH